jgi:hypothetical protein
MQQRLDLDVTAVVESSPMPAALDGTVDDDGMADGYHMLHEALPDKPDVDSDGAQQSRVL